MLKLILMLTCWGFFLETWSILCTVSVLAGLLVEEVCCNLEHFYTKKKKTSGTQVLVRVVLTGYYTQREVRGRERSEKCLTGYYSERGTRERKIREAFQIEKKIPGMNRDRGIAKSRTWTAIVWTVTETGVAWDQATAPASVTQTIQWHI